MISIYLAFHGICAAFMVLFYVIAAIIANIDDEYPGFNSDEAKSLAVFILLAPLFIYSLWYTVIQEPLSEKLETFLATVLD